jgi:hypothetical protein
MTAPFMQQKNVNAKTSARTVFLEGTDIAGLAGSAFLPATIMSLICVLPSRNHLMSVMDV